MQACEPFGHGSPIEKNVLSDITSSVKYAELDYGLKVVNNTRPWSRYKATQVKFQYPGSFTPCWLYTDSSRRKFTDMAHRTRAVYCLISGI